MKAAISSLIGLVLSISVSAEPLIEGRVRLESGEMVADAQVRLFDLTDLERGAVGRAMTDDTGYFVLPLAALPGMALPARFELGANYPNPFNPSTIIPYQLAASAAVRLEVFNLLGQRLATLVDGERPAGFHTATWNATDGAGRAGGAGVYIYRMTVGAVSQTGRMVLIDGQAGVLAAGAAGGLGASDGRSDGGDGQVYGLLVSGEGFAPYMDSAFRVAAGMAPVELVVSSGAGKATDDDCALCDFFDRLNDTQEEEALASGKVQATLAAPPEPTNLRVEAITDTSARVRWDAVEGATDYDVNYKKAQGGKWTNVPHKGIQLYNTLTGLEPGTQYRWAVRAENKDGTSNWVFGENFRTLGAPDPPTNLRITDLTETSVRLRWDAVEGATDYDVNYKKAQGGKWTNVPHKGIQLYNTLTGLKPGTQYRWAVRAENDMGPSAWVYADNFTTLGKGPDLIVQSPSVSAVLLTPGQAFTLNVAVHNQGDQQAAATVLHYYRSNNATITASDTQVGTDAVGELTASATHADSLALTAPTKALTYFYGACVDPVADESNTDNNCSMAVRTTVSGTGETAPEEAGTSDEQEKEEEEVAEDEVVRSGQAPIDHPDRWMDNLPEHDVLRIELVYLDDFPQWQKDEMRWAADLWELAFTRELPDYDVAEHDREWLSEYLSSQSVSGQPVRVPNVIDDVLVYVIKIPDDDPYSRKGRASTLLVRPHEDPGSCRPAYIGGREDLTVDPHGSCMGPTAMGIVYIVDAENNEKYGVDPYSEDWVVMSVDYTFAHEIGHVLGIGSTWLQYVYKASEIGETYYEKEPHFPDPYEHYYLDAPHVKAAFAEMNDLEVQREIMQSEGVYPDEDIEYAMSLGPWPTELVPMELYVTGSGPLQHWPQFPLGNSVMGGIGLITEPRISKVDLGILADIGYDVGETPTKPIPFWRYGVYNYYSRDKDGNRVRVNYLWGWNNRGPRPPRGRGKANVSGGAVHWCGGADLPAMEVLRRRR